MKTVLIIGLIASSVAAHAQTALPLPPGYPALLGVSCGGVATASYVTGFDAQGNILGEVYAWTSCGGSGRGGGYKKRLYQSWHSMKWTLSRQYTVLPYDSVVPDSTFTETDQYGNYIFDSCAGATNGQSACVAEANIQYIPPAP